MLAGLLRAPSRFAPTNDLDRARERAATIVGLMEEQGYLSREQAASAHSATAQVHSCQRLDLMPGPLLVVALRHSRRLRRSLRRAWRKRAVKASRRRPRLRCARATG